jgi:hypothetical protein
MPESVRECEQAYCDQPAEPEKPGFCQRHLEELRFMRARPQGELDWIERPDGNHFSDDASYAMAESWLGPTIEATAPR